MQDQPISGGDEPRNPSLTLSEDPAVAERVVLTHVLVLHPDHLTIPELVREITARSQDFAEGNAIECAVRDLTGAGLLHCPGGVVMPTQAALHFDRLELD